MGESPGIGCEILVRHVVQVRRTGCAQPPAVRRRGVIRISTGFPRLWGADCILYSPQMLLFSICLVAAAITYFCVASLRKPIDYAEYVRELKLNIPGESDNL